MNKIVIYLLIPIAIIISLSFTFLDKKATSEGYYIKNNGDTNKVTFFIKTELIGNELNYVGMQGYVKFMDKAGEKGKIIPDEVKEYAFEYLNKKYIYQTVKMTWNQYFPNNIFIKLQTDGKCKLYTYYQYEQHSHMLVSDPVIKKINTDAYLAVTGVAGKFISNQLNQGTLADYFSDCQQLYKKLKEKEYTANNAGEIVDFYNLNCFK